MAPKIEEHSIEETAALFGVTSRTLQNWRAAGMPHRMTGGRPKFVWRECIRWREETIRAEEREKLRGNAPVKDDDRLTRAQADLKEMELAERRRQLVPFEEFQAANDALVGGLAAVSAGRLKRFERPIVQAMTPAEARKVTQEIHRALMEGAREYADDLEAQAAAGEREEGAA